MNIGSNIPAGAPPGLTLEDLHLANQALDAQCKHWQELCMALAAKYLKQTKVLEPKVILSAESQEAPYSLTARPGIMLTNSDRQTVGYIFPGEATVLLTLGRPDGVELLFVTLEQAQELASRGAGQRLAVPDQGGVH